MNYDDLADSETHDDPREGFTDEELSDEELDADEVLNAFQEVVKAVADDDRRLTTIEEGHPVTDGWHCFSLERPPEGVPLLLCAPPDTPEPAEFFFHESDSADYSWEFVCEAVDGYTWIEGLAPEVFFWKVVSPMPDGVLFRLASAVNKPKVTT